MATRCCGVCSVSWFDARPRLATYDQGVPRFDQAPLADCKRHFVNCWALALNILAIDMPCASMAGKFENGLLKDSLYPVVIAAVRIDNSASHWSVTALGSAGFRRNEFGRRGQAHCDDRRRLGVAPNQMVFPGKSKGDAVFMIVDVRESAHAAIILNPCCEISEMNWDLAYVDLVVLGTPLHCLGQPVRVPTLVLRQKQLGELHGIAHSDATMAERAHLGIEKTPAWRIV
jgi:hypothetical protein